MSDFAIPTSISFTDEDIARGAARDTLAQGWFRFVVVASDRKVSERGKNPGSLMIQRQVAALSDPEDANSAVRPYLYDNLILPFANEEVAGHTAPKTAGLMADALRAMFPEEIPAMPRRNTEGHLEFNGAVIDKSEEQAKRQEVMALVYEKLRTLWEDPQTLVGCAYYAEVYENDGYRNLRKPCAELPDGVSLVPADAMREVSLPVAPTSTTTSKPAKANGKAPAKSAGKKR